MWTSDRHFRIPVDPHDPAAAARAWRILSTSAFPFVRDITPAHHSVTISLDPLLADPAPAVDAILAALASSPSHSAEPVLHTIPTCYHASLAPDLADVAALTSLSTKEVIQRHTAPTYTVRYIGFSPGFPYLEGLDPALACPRLASPRPRIPPCSVAIAANQAGIYPHATPGGWRLIGRTTARLFDPARTPPALLAPSDRLRFVEISLDQYLQASGSSSP